MYSSYTLAYNANLSYTLTMQLQKSIEQLGYTPKEARVYLAALDLGEAHISDIASKAKLPRSSAQAVVVKLHKDGLMDFYVQRRYKYWVAENPEHLLTHIEKREEVIREALPALIALRKAHRGKAHHKGDAARVLGLFRVIADASAQPVLIANGDVEIEYMNAAWRDQFGYSLEEVVGQNPRILQSGKTPREVYERMWQALRAGKMFQTDEVIDKRKNGTFFNLLSTTFSVNHADHLYYIQILDDITEQKRLEKLKKDFTSVI